jgi:RNA polymerase sigma-70 factor (ECF subfamily)
MNCQSSTPNQQALAEAYQAMREQLLGWINRKVSEPSDAEDLLQEVFKKALVASHGDGMPPDNISAWLFTITRNTVVDYYRSRRAMFELPEDLQVDDESHDAHHFLAMCLLPMAQQLPAIYRDAVVAVDFEKQSLQAAATTQDVSLSAMKSRVVRGRQLLQKSLLVCCDIEATDAGMVEDFVPKHSLSRC